MRIIHAVMSLAVETGGPRNFALGQCRALRALGEDVLILATTAFMKRKDIVPLEKVVDLEGVPVIYFNNDTAPMFAYSKSLTDWLGNNLKKVDIVHVHEIFSYIQLISAHYSKRRRIKYVLQPNGIFSDYAIKHHYWRKQLYLNLFWKKYLEGAGSIICSSFMERDQIEKSHLNTRLDVLYMGIDSRTKPSLDIESRQLGKGNRSSIRITYLSRLVPHKGIDLFLFALSKLRSRDNVCVSIAGEGSVGYMCELRRLVRQLKLDGIVQFLGLVEGDRKARLLEDSDIFALVSHGESFGFAVLEALNHGVPVLISDQSGISELVMKYNAGFVVRCDAGDVTFALERLIAERELRIEMGKNARRIACEVCDWSVVTPQLMDIYKSCLK